MRRLSWVSLLFMLFGAFMVLSPILAIVLWLSR